MSPAIQPQERILVDCRWLGLGGVGRATEYLLRGLAELQPPGRWLLWGPQAVEPYVWSGARHVLSRFPPQALFGMREVFDLPTHDKALYMHISRPLRPGRSLTLIHDTIHLRYRSLPRRLGQRAYNAALARLSTRFMTVSEYSRTAITRDMGIPRTLIDVASYPIDAELVARVLDIRSKQPRRERAIYVGQFASHKNLGRLVAAFPRTRFAGSGGELLLVGGNAEQASGLRKLAPQTSQIQIQEAISQPALEELYATSRLLVLPSLEEGFGLPAWEALSVGLPVCAADAGALPEITRGKARLFDPYSIDAIAAAIDETAAAGPPSLDCTTTMSDYARSFVEALAKL